MTSRLGRISREGLTGPQIAALLTAHAARDAWNPVHCRQALDALDRIHDDQLRNVVGLTRILLSGETDVELLKRVIHMLSLQC